MNISKTVIVILCLVLCAIMFAGCFISTKNECVRHEASIEAQYKQNQNNASNYFLKLKELAQVPDMYTEDLKKVYDSTMRGRYGTDGSKALFQFIQEKNPELDPMLYRQIQQAMEAGRNSFEADQKTLLDKKRVYEVMLGSFPSGTVAAMWGYPRKDLSQYDIVIDDRTEEMFKTKKQAPIKLKE